MYTYIWCRCVSWNTHVILHSLKIGPLSLWATRLVFLHMHVGMMTVHLCSFEPVDWVSNELRALLFTFGYPVALLEQVVVYLLSQDAVLLVLRVLGNKFPHPLGHSHQFTCYKSQTFRVALRDDAAQREIWFWLLPSSSSVRWCKFTWGTFLDELQIIQNGAPGIHIHFHVLQVAVKDRDKPLKHSLLVKASPEAVIVRGLKTGPTSLQPCCEAGMHSCGWN